MRKLTLIFSCALLVGACSQTKKPADTKGQKAAATGEKKATTTPKKEADKPAAKPNVQAAKKVELKTSLGSIVVELDAEKAPLSAANFTDYVKRGHYDGTIFHRVIKTFMIQGGGFDKDKKKKPTLSPVQNEADNGLKNVRGTLAMARTRNPHSASAQFFINVVDNAFLDHREKSLRGWGYTVFGKVVQGMEVVDKIKDVPIKNEGGPFANMPQPMVVIEKATVLE